MDERTRVAARVFMALVLACFLPLCFLGEKIAVNQGYGFDGFLFGPMARDLPGALPGLSLYRQQRLLPPALVYYGHVALGLPVSDAGVVAGFVVLAALSVALAALLWGRIAALLGLSPPGLFLGGIGLFANFATLKMLSYYPVLVDGPTFVLGLAALWLWLERREIALALLTIASAFVSSTAVLFCVPLLVFPAQPGSARAVLPERSSPAGLALVGAAASLALAALDPWPWLEVERPGDAAALAVSALLAGAWVFLGLRPLAAAIDLDGLLPLLRRNAARAALAALTVGLVAAASSAAQGQNEYPLDFRQLGPRLLARALWFPGGFAVAHVLYFGPIVALAAWRFRAVATAAGSYGPALPIVLALAVVTSLNSESRHHVFVLPFLAALTAKVFDQDGLSWQRVALFGVVSLAASRAWLPLGPVPGPAYWMNFGPSWSWTVYRTNLALGAVMSVAALLALRSRR